MAKIMETMRSLFGGKSRNAIESINQLNTSDTARKLSDEIQSESGVLDCQSLAKLRDISSDRATQYATYDNMLKDSVISAAVEMYADDSCQEDIDGKSLWVTSEDSKVETILNNIIEQLGLEEDLWSMYYALATYGDVYIRLYKKSGASMNEARTPKGAVATNLYDGSKDIMTNPECIFDLVDRGKTVQFAVIDKPDTERLEGLVSSSGLTFYDYDDIVHIYLKRPYIHDNQKLKIAKYDKNTKKRTIIEYNVRRGKSMLADIVVAQREVELLENTLILNRLSRSAITRLVSVEVGDMPKSEVRNLLFRVKSSLENKLSINVNSGKFDNYVSPGQLDNIIVSTTRNGKGAISHETIGGDVDVKSLLDIDYFSNKKFSGLKIPKPFLGFDDTVGGSSGGALTKLDSRYGRTIKKLQKAMRSGISTILDLYLKDKGMEDSIGN